jgi:tetratricopeptide (TPR) repeat protein
MGTLLVVLIVYFNRTNIGLQPSFVAAPPPPARQAALPGKNEITALSVKQDENGTWTADVDYYYTGEPQFATLRIVLTPLQVGAPSPEHSGRLTTYLLSFVQRGRHHASGAITYPGNELTTRQIEAKLLGVDKGGERVIASQRVDKVINWPTFVTWLHDREMAQNSPQANLDHAVALIDAGSPEELTQAKAILERLIGQNARFDAAYVEMARIAMKANWGPQSLHEAETLLSSALEINPSSVNAKVLLGYVYAHQKQFARAENLYSELSHSETRNLWLWTNWGELYEMQGKSDLAIVKYREAVSRPMTHDTYDRARADAYRRLLALLERRRDLDGMEALYKQRIAEFGPGSCYSSDYARFKLQTRGDTQGAIDLARGALNQDCEDSQARQILGLAEYVEWASTTGAQRNEALNQARIYLPVGPMALYLLATSERTVAAAKGLAASGESLDQQDNDGLTALAIALQNADLAAAKRLLALGARPDAPTGMGHVPVALIPVIEGNVDAIRLMRRFGVDYSKLRFRGATAFDVAKQSGNKALLDALGQSTSVL